MGIVGNEQNLNSGQFPHVTSTHPLSRYGTEHPVDKLLWRVDRATEIHKKLKGTKGPKHTETVLNTTVSHQKGAK